MVFAYILAWPCTHIVRVCFLRETMDLFWIKTILGKNYDFFLCANIFPFWCLFRIQNVFFTGLLVNIIQRHFLICLHHSQSQELPSNSKGRLSIGRKYVSLWRSEEKRTVTALARRGETLLPCTASSGGRTACWQGPGCSPACPLASSSSGSSVFTQCFFSPDTNVLSALWFG